VGGVAEQLTVHWLPVQSITDSQRNPRHKLGGIDELASSLDAHGMLQPVIVRTVDDRYELVAGHRRFRAAQQLGWRQIPAIIRSESENDAYVLTLVENLQREDLSPREEAEALEVLVRDRGWSTRQVASAIGRSQAFVSKRLRVFEDPILAPAVLHNQVSVSAAEELLTASERERYDLLARAIAGGWDRAQVRRSIHEKSTRAPSQRRAVGRRAHELRMQLRLVRPEDLTEAERRELRALFQELSMLARARPGAPRVFPPLPAARKR
jgi:ParB family chromosome partitioning protein